MCIFLVECKSRCASSTEIGTKGLVHKLGKNHPCMSLDDPRLSKITASTHELAQFLYYTAIHDLNCVLLLIGDLSVEHYLDHG